MKKAVMNYPAASSGELNSKKIKELISIGFKTQKGYNNYTFIYIKKN